MVMTTLNPDIALFPPIFLDKLSCSIHWKGGNNVCKHYTDLEKSRSPADCCRAYRIRPIRKRDGGIKRLELSLLLPVIFDELLDEVGIYNHQN